MSKVPTRYRPGLVATVGRVVRGPDEDACDVGLSVSRSQARLPFPQLYAAPSLPNDAHWPPVPPSPNCPLNRRQVPTLSPGHVSTPRVVSWAPPAR